MGRGYSPSNKKNQITHFTEVLIGSTSSQQDEGLPYLPPQVINLIIEITKKVINPTANST